MITLREITRDNYVTCLNLKVSKEQESFVAPNTWSLAQSKYETECIPLAIYKDDEMVGFLLYCIADFDNNYWIYRLMIDEKYQRKGYAYQAMLKLLEIITADKNHNKIYIDHHPDNIEANKLYSKLGFKKTDEFAKVDDFNIFMRYDY